jgi:cold shock CspA family protein
MAISFRTVGDRSGGGPGEGRERNRMPQATVKRYDSITRTGVLVADDGSTEYEIDPEAMASSMFRFLRPGQRVTFDFVRDGSETRIRNLRIGIV